ncbi:uncharacterized protein LOC122282425 [Carya illinoinensis]|uniref:uncharacterized protein LOC122282425 n=1 Tax=Carya illinoinensis TaxID=32201 RepID=UPI001C71A6B2|nr:uncharacterized protein LOC122282425 [Carya illinoinensis]
MAEDLEFLYGKMSLIETEKEVVAVDDEIVQENLVRGKKCLIVQLLTTKHYNKEAFKQVLRKIWRPLQPLRLQSLGTKFLIAEFEDVKDQERILRDGPWSFDKQLVLLKKFDGLLQTHQITLTKAFFWVRIHDLPLMARSQSIGFKIGASLGKVLEVDLLDGECEWGEFMRVRICIDVSKPLLRGKQVSLGGLGTYWVRFSYERLPEFCYLCGRIGHVQRDCEQAVERDVLNGSLPYGQWLRDLGQTSSSSVPFGRQQPSTAAHRAAASSGNERTEARKDTAVTQRRVNPGELLAAKSVQILNEKINAIKEVEMTVEATVNGGSETRTKVQDELARVAVNDMGQDSLSALGSVCPELGLSSHHNEPSNERPVTSSPSTSVWKRKIARGKQRKDDSCSSHKKPSKRVSTTKLKEAKAKKGRSISEDIQICYLHEVPVCSSAVADFQPCRKP